MLLAVSAGVVAILAVAADLLAPRVRRRVGAWQERTRARRHPAPVLEDPGRDRRAEQRARALLRSCVNEEEWEMYRDLGLIRVRSSDPRQSASAYLLYPHLPIVAYELETGRLLGEYCVTFEDQAKPYGSGRLPDSDDVLAKWMALTGDEPRLISLANMHLPGRQIDTEQVGRDLRRLGQWERGRRAQQQTTASAS